MKALASLRPKRSPLESHAVFVLLLSTFVVIPLAPERDVGASLVGALFQVMLAGTLLAVLESRVLLLACLVLVVASSIARLSPILPHELRHGVSNALAIPLLSILIGASTRRLLRAEKVDAQLVSSGLNVYLFLGLLWFLAYSVLEWARPGSFLEAGQPVSTFRPAHELFYFSYTTLTTLGFGDVVAVSDLARSLAVLEAVIGQLFLVVAVSGLVGLHVAERTART